MNISLEVAMIHDSPYEAIDPKDTVAAAQRAAFEAACEINKIGATKDLGRLVTAQRMQTEANLKASDANLMTPAMMPPQTKECAA